MEKNPAQPVPHVAIFDGLRGVAILLVLLIHAVHDVGESRLGRLGTQGIFGVQLFFTVSAATLMLASGRRSGLDAVPFGVRRLARIAPLYLAGIVAYLLITTPIPNHAPTPLRVLVNVLLLQGFVPDARNSVVPGGWSIGCEMIFYAAFPLVFRTITTLPRALALLAATWAVDLGLILAGKRLGWDLSTASALYYGFPFQMPAFATGIAAYQLVNALREPKGAARIGLGIFATAALPLILWTSYDVVTRLWIYLPVTLGLGLFVAAAMLLRPRPLTWAPLVRLGLDSYSFYVWHWAFLFGIVIPYVPHVGGGTVTLLLRIAATLALAWPVSELTRRFIELPGIEAGRRVIERMRRRPATG